LHASRPSQEIPRRPDGTHALVSGADHDDYRVGPYGSTDSVFMITGAVDHLWLERPITLIGCALDQIAAAAIGLRVKLAKPGLSLDNEDFAPAEIWHARADDFLIAAIVEPGNNVP
jgi:hypothetical protein